MLKIFGLGHANAHSWSHFSCLSLNTQRHILKMRRVLFSFCSLRYNLVYIYIFTSCFIYSYPKYASSFLVFDGAVSESQIMYWYSSACTQTFRISLSDFCLNIFLNLPLLRLNTKERNSDTGRFEMILEPDQQITEEVLVFLCIDQYSDSKHKMIYKTYFCFTFKLTEIQ
jgi:hypothetical protein